jgi:alpha-tubulin suppressor-like RCC1 family protein
LPDRRSQTRPAKRTIDQDAAKDSTAITSEGVAYAWGSDGADSACGEGTDLTSPQEVVTGIKAAAGAGPHTLLLTDDNTILVCGSNKEGELGLGKGVRKVKKPSPLSGLTDVCAISAGEFTSEALKCDGGGRLGQGSTEGTTTLTPVFVDSGVESVAATAENVLETK